MRPKLKDIESSLEGLDFDQALERLYEIEKKYDLTLARLIEKYTVRKHKFQAEVDRYNKMTEYEINAYEMGYKAIAGIDEAGRGPLAGPVVAAAVILPEGTFIEGLNDSKKLTAKLRDTLYDIIREKALNYAVGIVDHEIIDEMNILNATRKAMKIAVEGLKSRPDLLLIDAEKLRDVDIEQRSIIKGDSLSISIAAASIIAKVTRDRILDELDGEYPEYGFAKHKGYGTKEHIMAIKKCGICPIHRRSFTKNFTS